MHPSKPVSSPCISVCTMDEQTQLCIGCFRTLEEVAAWEAMSNAQREAVLAQLPARRSSLR